MNLGEALYVITFELCVYVSFAFMLNIIWDYIQEYRSDNERYQKNMVAINRYLKLKDIDPKISLKVNKYLEYQLAEDISREEEIE